MERKTSSLSEKDLISMRDAAKRLKISCDQVMFLLEDGHLTQHLYLRHPTYHAQVILSPFDDQSNPTKAPILKWLEIKQPFRWMADKILISDANVLDEHFIYYKTQTFNMTYDIGLIRLDKNEVERNMHRKSHKKASRDKDNSLDFVISWAVAKFVETGESWNYNKILHRIEWLRTRYDEISDIVQSVDIKNSIIYWKEDAVGVSGPTKKRTFQNRLTSLYPKKQRPHLK